MYYLRGDVITDSKLFKEIFVEISEDKISYIGKEKRNSNFPVKVIKNGFICPGFIDIHLHGIDGFDFMDHDTEAFFNIAKELPKYGVTSFLATSRTASIKNTMEFLEEAKKHSSEEGAKMIGVHLEGPWISSQYSGAQSKDLIRQFSWEDVEEVIKPFQSIIKRVTLAPEELNDFSIIEHLDSLGISVSAGHTNASIDQIGYVMKYGLKQTTHTFNAMSPMHHRQPGTAAAALYFDELICEVITDGVHVHPKMIELLYKVKGVERMVLVSDCTGYNKLPDGEYELRGKKLIREGNRVTLKNGALAGSAITLDKGMKYLTEHCSMPLEEAVYMATQTPLSTVDTGCKSGRITQGYKADLVILDSDYKVSETIIDGKTVFLGQENM